MMNPVIGLAVFLFSISMAEEPQFRNIHSSENIIVEINRQDLQALGEWPLERRWYGLAIVNLLQGGADSIYIDITFPNADPLRPESDNFFYNKVIHNDAIFLQTGQNHKPRDSTYVLGSKSFPTDRLIVPFSESFVIDDQMVMLERMNPLSLASNRIRNRPERLPVVVPFPEQFPPSDYTFLDIIKNEFSLPPGANVLIHLDHPGLSSYIATAGNRNIPASLVQWWAVDQIVMGRFSYLWPSWIHILTALLLFAPILINISRLRRWSYLLVSSYAAGLILLLIYFISQIHVPVQLYYAALLPLPFMLFQYAKFRSVKNLPAEYFEGSEQQLTDSERKELEDLRYRIGFYDKIKNTSFSNGRQFVKNENIICHENSPVMDILVKAQNVASTSIPVLITGESGTGKEELARFIHRHSRRADQPFVALNCGSLNENLIESELFGHEKGAFTGAEQVKIGRFELADGGTLFLDEIAETTPAFQVKLLRVLQEGKFERVGGTEEIESSARVITATHQNIKECVKENDFREDLYYRLNGFAFSLPPLRERTMDIPLLFDHFLKESASGTQLHYSEALIKWLTMQPWKGNIRELKSATERAVLNAGIENRDLLLPIDFDLDQPVSEGNEKAIQILELLKKYSSDYRFISRVADSIGMHRVTVTEYLRGWIIYYLVRGMDADQIAREFTGDTVNSETIEQLAGRLSSYRETIETRILKGMKQGKDPDEIEERYFSQMPKFFSDDLKLLITHYNEKSNYIRLK